MLSRGRRLVKCQSLLSGLNQDVHRNGARVGSAKVLTLGPTSHGVPHSRLHVPILPLLTVSHYSSDVHTVNRVTVASSIDTWVELLTQADIPEPRQSVQLIVAHALGKKMIHEVDQNDVISEEIFADIERMCKLRLKRCPVPYIIEEWDFHSLTLKMEPPVLIPRPETEELAKYIVQDDLTFDPAVTMETDKNIAPPGGHVYLDIGCGSGAITLHILTSLPQARCVAVDVNKTACDLTQHNAQKYGVEDRLHVIHADITSALDLQNIQSHGPFSVLVSNPPYIPSPDMKHLDTQISRYEDHNALHGGEEGLDIVKAIMSASSQLLTENGTVWLEVDLSHPGKIQQMCELYPEYRLDYLQTIHDFTKRGRFCKLQRKRMIVD